LFPPEQTQPRFEELGGGRYRATGLVPGWSYLLSAEAKGYRDLGISNLMRRITVRSGETVVAPPVKMSWWGPKAVPALVEQLQNKDSYRREDACRLLAELGPEAAAAVPALITAIRADPLNTVRFEAATALGKIGLAARPAVPDLIRALAQDQGGGVDREAATALGLIGIGDPQVLPALRKALTSPDGEVTTAAAQAIAKIEKVSTKPAAGPTVDNVKSGAKPAGNERATPAAGK
jgi:HEAT repeat protein